jgi:hypothetical protein
MSAPRFASDEQRETQKQLDTTCWLYYCGCCGVGKATCGDPYCQGKSKVCCIAQDFKTTNFYNDTEGLCAGTNKFCCLISNCILPAPQPFVEVCGKRLCGHQKPADAESENVGDDLSNISVKTLRSQVKDALKSENYDEALRLVGLLKTKKEGGKYSSLPAVTVMSNS